MQAVGVHIAALAVVGLLVSLGAPVRARDESAPDVPAAGGSDEEGAEP